MIHRARRRGAAGRGRAGAAERSRHRACTRGDASMMPALKIERCEQFYTDTDARSAQTYSYGALPVISPRLKSARGPSPIVTRMVARSPSRGHRAPWPGELVIGWCLCLVCYMRKRTEPRITGLCFWSPTPIPLGLRFTGAAVRHEARRRAAAGEEITEQAKKRDALRDCGAQEPLDRGVPPPSR
jgi:hypothetical protein